MALEALVRQAWDLATIEAAYEQFLADFGGTDEPPDALRGVTELVHAWRRFPWTDPVLPRELLPNPWSGESAAALFERRHDEWAGAAREQWESLER